MNVLQSVGSADPRQRFEGGEEEDVEERPVRSIMKLYQDRIRQASGVEKGGGFGVSFSRSKTRDSLPGAQRPQLGEQEGGEGVEGGVHQGVKTINMLTLARKARLPIDELINCLAASGDTRNVRVRAESPQHSSSDIPVHNGEREPLLTSLSVHSASVSDCGSTVGGVKYVDVSFGECDLHPSDHHGSNDLHLQNSNSQHQQDVSGSLLTNPAQEGCLGFGLLLSPSAGASGGGATGDSVSEGDVRHDAFKEWLAAAPSTIPRPLPRVSLAVETQQAVSLEHEAFLVLDPTSLGPDSTPQWVFAVPFATVRERERGHCGRCLFPSEIENVTLYCEQHAEGPALSTVVMSVELSRPGWAWCILALGILSASITQPLLARLNTFSQHSTSAALWWGQANFISFTAMLGATLLYHPWKASELSLLKDVREGMLPLAALALLWTGVALLWTAATNVSDDDTVGPTSQGIVLHAMHPVYIVLWRWIRRQPVFPGELFGLVLVLGGMTLVAWPDNSDDWNKWGASDGAAAGSAFFLAAYLITGKTLAAQLPAAVVLAVPAVLALVPLLVAAAAKGLEGDGFFGWGKSSHATSVWVALLFLSAVQQLSFVHSLRYLHPFAISVAMCLSALLSVFWMQYVFSEVAISGGFGTALTVPGCIVAVVGSTMAAYSSVIRRQHVEIEITREHILKRQRSKRKLTPSTLQRSQDVYDSSLYASASKGQPGAEGQAEDKENV